jgi:hypothetical protein
MTHPSPSPEELQPEDGQPAEPTPAPSEEEYFLKLDSRNLQAEIARLKAQNQDFLRLYNTDIGNVAARKYKPQIDAKERELADLRMQIRRNEIERMEEKEIEEKFASDPSFAKEYAELVHYKPNPSTYQEDPTPLILEEWEEIMNDARAKGISEDFIVKVTEKASQGGYSAEGEHWSRSLRRLQADITNEAIRIHSEKPSKPAINEASLKGGPDLSSGVSSGGQVSQFKTIADFKSLPRAEQMSILATSEGKKAVEELAKKGI